LPELRYVLEPILGLTAARLRGARETTAPWIAFVDDDNFLDSGWLEAIARTIGVHGEAGGIGGKVVPDWEVPPPAYLKEFGFCFAAQDHERSGIRGQEAANAIDDRD
jgi:glycosyltransferase involved in cell wall biosynthesis